MENRTPYFHDWFRFATSAVVCWIAIFSKLGDTALMDPDEAHYAQLTHEMLQAGNWMIPLLDGVPYIDKPVLFHWMQSAAIAVLGETETAMRLPSACAALALFWLTQWTAVQLFNVRVGACSWLMLATMPLTFMLGSIGVFDMVFTAFLFGAIALAIVSVLRARPRLQYVSYVLLSLAVMTKGPAALVLAGLFFLAALGCGRECRTAILSLHWKTGVVLSVVLSLPWFLWMYDALGWTFVHQYVLAGNVYYITQPESFSKRAVNHTLYLSTFLAGFFPWSIVTLGAGVDAIRRWRAKSRFTPEEVLLWAWIGVIFVFFTLARFKVDRYVYPAAPACCLLAARAWLGAGVTRADLAIVRDNLAARWSVMVLGVVLTALGIVAGFSAFNLDLELPTAVLVVPITLATGGVILALTIFTLRAVSSTLFAMVIVMLLVTYGSITTLGFPVLERARPMAAVAKNLRSTLAPHDRVGLYRLEKWRFSLRYYLGRPVSRLQHPEDVRDFLNKGSRGHVLMLEHDFARLRNNGVKLRCISKRRAVTGTTGRGLRKQKWGSLVVATVDNLPLTTEKPRQTCAPPALR